MQILIFIVPLILLWFVLLRPQQKRMREQQAMTQRAGFGDEIVTAGGFVATIVEVHDPDDEDNVLEVNEVVVALAEGVEVHMFRHGISSIRNKWDGEYSDGSVHTDFVDDLELSPGPIDDPAEAPESPVDGD